jgi:hypothetical protein
MSLDLNSIFGASSGGIPGAVQDIPGGGSSSSGPGAGEAAAIGAAIGSIIPGLGTAVGGAIGAAVGALGIRGKTPILSWEETSQIASKATEDIRNRLTAAGIIPKYSSELGGYIRQYGRAYIESNNPGMSGLRYVYLRDLETDPNVGQFVFLYNLQGTARDPNTTWGIRERVADVVNKVVVPALQDLARAHPSLSVSSVAPSGVVTAAQKPDDVPGDGFDLANVPEYVWILAVVAVIVAVLLLTGRG